MIVDLFLSTIYGLITTPLSVLPDLPPMPDVVVNALSLILDFVRFGSAFVAQFYGHILWTAIVATVVAIFTLEQIYHFVLFVLKKIPFISVK